jgi:hypothetical protein
MAKTIQIETEAGVFNLDELLAEARRELAMRREPAVHISVGEGQTLLIEKRDLWIFESRCWSVRKHRNTHYLYAAQGAKKLHLHREILNAPEDLEVDHRNGDGLDNRRSNLRLATRIQNSWNRTRSKTNQSGYLGVDYHKKLGYWRARLSVKGKLVHCSYHADALTAAQVRDEAAKNYFGEWARLNFPETAQTEADRQISLMLGIVKVLEKLKLDTEELPLFG